MNVFQCAPTLRKDLTRKDYKMNLNSNLFSTQSSENIEIFSSVREMIATSDCRKRKKKMTAIKISKVLYEPYVLYMKLGYI